MASKIWKSCFHWLSERFVTAFLFRSGCTVFNFCKSKFKVGAAASSPEVDSSYAREKQSETAEKPDSFVDFLIFTPLFRLFETVSSYNYPLNSGFLGARHESGDISKKQICLGSPYMEKPHPSPHSETFLFITNPAFPRSDSTYEPFLLCPILGLYCSLLEGEVVWARKWSWPFTLRELGSKAPPQPPRKILWEIELGDSESASGNLLPLPK